MPGPAFIEGESLALHTVEREDIDFLHRTENRPEVRRYISLFNTPTNRENREERFETYDSHADSATLLAVPHAGEFAGDPVGSFQLYPLKPKAGWANLGIWLAPEAQGRGYATEASALLIDHGFDQHRLHRISAGVLGPNDASHALMERLGFTREGVIRETDFVDGAFVDTVKYGLLRREWPGSEQVVDT
jgi:ribosomal-protein-alanine N-acetyltransferase